MRSKQLRDQRNRATPNIQRGGNFKGGDESCDGNECVQALQTKTCIVAVPPRLVDTTCGWQLVNRILKQDFKVWTLADVSKAWQKPVPLNGLLKIERTLGLQPPAEERVCVRCKTASRLKCSVCLRTHYCSFSCQKADWPSHRSTCSKPKLQLMSNLAVAMPDYQCFFSYQNWVPNTPRDGGNLGVVVMARQDFIDTFGSDNEQRTCLSLATFGRPQCLILRIFRTC